MSRWQQVLGFVIAITWLHAVAVVPLLYDSSQWPDSLRAIQPDLLLLLGVAVIGGAAGRPKLLAHVSAALLLLSICVRLAMVIVRTNFQRDFELGDFMLFSGLYHALTNAAEPWQCWCGSIAALLAIWLVHWLTARAFHAVAMPAKRPTFACVWIVVIQLAMVVGAIWPAAPLHRSVLVPFADCIASAVRYALDPGSVLDPIRRRIDAGARRMADVPSGLERLEGADVHVLVLESYGRMAFRHAELGAALSATWDELEPRLLRAGFAACTAVCSPAIAGGLSGLAHAELLSGVAVPNERTRTMLLNSSLVALPHRFRTAGYHTAEVQPAMDRAWPRGEAFYGIEESIWQRQLSYRGQKYDFGQMPDQYSLRHLLEHVVLPAQKPVFSMWVGVSGHAPWSATPPFVDDWSQHQQVYEGGPASLHEIGYATMHRSPAAVTAYRDAMQYVLRSVVDFIYELPRPSLVIVLGDHQPPIATAVSPPDHTHEVPVHVLSNRPELLVRLQANGFAEGLAVPPDAQALPMADLAPMLLRTFSK